MSERPMCDAARVGIKYGTYGYYTIALPWAKCASIRECIAPIGTDRKNHRQDQAALSCLIHHAAIQGVCNPNDKTKWHIERWWDAKEKWRTPLKRWQQEIFKGDPSLWPTPPRRLTEIAINSMNLSVN